ncbi:acyltransferase domain-containing protein [Streptomyces clavuligerus]|nr:acyltransferase domain-containing protein [Streptomyces clavuligerus]WDN51376.1 acyltransferase domain-containing protein [Streptomyces clavuligerus]
MTSTDLSPPEGDELADALLDLAVPHEDIGALLALRPRMTDDPELRDPLMEAAGRMVEAIGRVDGRWEPEPRLEAHGPGTPVARSFVVFVLLAVLPHIRAYHRERGVPDQVSRRTLADLGRQMALHRRRHGTGGVAHPGWLALHFRGELFHLGRLQFQRGRLDRLTGEGLRALGEPYGPGDPTLDLHIPDFLGPLAPDACDRALTAAGTFFDRCFPDEPYPIATCHSWLLDPQFADRLPKTSNILRFQERFDIHGTWDRPADSSVIGFVFGDPDLPPDALPRRTALERAIGDHLRSGGHWYVGHGWFRR